jgi:hypothetical protein
MLAGEPSDIAAERASFRAMLLEHSPDAEAFLRHGS